MIDWRSTGMRLRAGPTSALAVVTALPIAASSCSWVYMPSTASATAAAMLSVLTPCWASVRSACAVFEPSR